MTYTLSSSLTTIPFIGESYQRKLAKLNLNSVGDLLHHYPSKYLDRRLATPIADLEEETKVTVVACVDKFDNIFTKYGKKIQKAKVTDETGVLEITWFNQTYLSQVIKTGESYAFSGKVKRFNNKLTLSSPDFEWLADGDLETSQTLHTGRLTPVYGETAGVSSKWLRSRIDHVLKNITIDDFLPESIKQQHHLIDLNIALKQIHQPDDQEMLDSARNRLAFDELFLLQFQGAKRRYQWQQNFVSQVLKWGESEVKVFIQKLPFQLTTAQKKATQEILSDLKRSQPMNRLLEGDVGSGKTVVAAISLYATVLSGHRGILMAPTEILAQQHHKELTKLFAHTSMKIGLISSSTKSDVDAEIVVGTHALLHQTNIFNKVGLIIIDEQHRFGVEQRARLERLAIHPHRLTMSATPIPRTVALTLFGDLDVSIIDQMPVNRTPTKTWLVPESKRQAGYDWIKQQMHVGDQVFVVCPLIDQSTSIKLQGIRSAAQEYEYLKGIFPEFKLALLHGRMKPEEKDQVITDFKLNRYHILVSTQVIEVGIDIPNATVMVIEAAERFGLAQLHQLRGRVGRGSKPGFCLLFTTDDTQSQRLKSLTKYNSGFKLAEIDLKLRGPGEVFGVNQHGFDQLRLAKLNNVNLVKTTKLAAQSLIKSDPHLESNILLKEKLSQIEEHMVAEN